jgi:hypothetical protein
MARSIHIAVSERERAESGRFVVAVADLMGRVKRLGWPAQCVCWDWWGVVLLGDPAELAEWRDIVAAEFPACRVSVR